MPNRTPLLAAASLALAWLAPAAGAAEVEAVASFSILADIVENVGGDRVSVRTLVGPGGDAHVYQPTPADAEAITQADIVFVNGLGFEGWLPRLVEAAATKAPIVEAAAGVAAHRAQEEGHGHEAEEGGHAQEAAADQDHGALDPHAWQDVGNALTYVMTIADGLCRVDAAGCDSYRANAAAYTETLKALDAEVKAAIGGLSPAQRTIITPHDALGYYARAYGLTILAPEGFSTESEASAQDVAAMIDQIRERKASALFVENIKDPRLIEQISEETGAVIGGELYSDALSGKDGPAPTYVDMIRHNTQTIVAGVTGS